MDTPGSSTYLALVFLVACSGFFSASETALSTFNKVRMQNLAEKGNRKAGIALQLSEHYSKTLSTILIGNNIDCVAGRCQRSCRGNGGNDLAGAGFW